jgi:ankyrin repeat protein
LSCYNREINLEMLDILYEAYPDSLRMADGYGDFPIHNACTHDSHLSAAIVDWFLERCPTALQQVDVDGGLALHVAAYSDCSTDVTRYLIEKYPKALEIPNHYGYLPLHHSVSLGRLDRGRAPNMEVVQHLLDAYPSAMQQADAYGDLPLHVACSNSLARDAVALLVRRYAEGVGLANKDGKLPIHCAVGRDLRIDLEVLDVLLEAFPNGLCSADGNGNFPIHLACGNEENLSVDIIGYFVQKWPASLHQADCDGSFPVHWAASNAKCPLDVIKHMIDLFPNSLRVQDMCGNLPLHYVVAAGCGGDGPNLENLTCLLEAYGDGTRRANIDGFVPLHTACRNALAGAAIDVLVRRDPECLGRFDESGCLPIHIACMRQTSVEVLERLIGRYPKDAALPHTRDGVPPLFLAAEHNDSLEVIKFLVERSPELFHDSASSASRVVARRPTVRRLSRKRNRSAS